MRTHIALPCPMPQVVSFTRRSKSSELFDPPQGRVVRPSPREGSATRCPRWQKSSAAINRAHERGLKA